MPRDWQPQKLFNLNYDWWLIPKPMKTKEDEEGNSITTGANDLVSWEE